jgi:hypothetical protein
VCSGVAGDQAREVRAYQGSEEIRASYKANWNATPVQVDEIHDVVVYESTDPEVIIGEWGGTGTLTTSGGPSR